MTAALGCLPGFRSLAIIHNLFDFDCGVNGARYFISEHIWAAEPRSTVISYPGTSPECALRSSLSTPKASILDCLPTLLLYASVAFRWSKVLQVVRRKICFSMMSRTILMKSKPSISSATNANSACCLPEGKLKCIRETFVRGPCSMPSMVIINGHCDHRSGDEPFHWSSRVPHNAHREPPELGRTLNPAPGKWSDVANQTITVHNSPAGHMDIP